MVMLGGGAGGSNFAASGQKVLLARAPKSRALTLRMRAFCSARTSRTSRSSSGGRLESSWEKNLRDGGNAMQPRLRVGVMGTGVRSKRRVRSMHCATRAGTVKRFVWPMVR